MHVFAISENDIISKKVKKVTITAMNEQEEIELAALVDSYYKRKDVDFLNSQEPVVALNFHCK